LDSPRHLRPGPLAARPAEWQARPLTEPPLGRLAEWQARPLTEPPLANRLAGPQPGRLAEWQARPLTEPPLANRLAGPQSARLAEWQARLLTEPPLAERQARPQAGRPAEWQARLLTEPPLADRLVGPRMGPLAGPEAPELRFLRACGVLILAVAIISDKSSGFNRQSDLAGPSPDSHHIGAGLPLGMHHRESGRAKLKRQVSSDLLISPGDSDASWKDG
jgi:hypothetical protein